MNPLDRFNDLQRQGFMRAVYAKPVKVKKAKVMVACDGCSDWHIEGKHTSDAATRKARLAEIKAAKVARDAFYQTLDPESEAYKLYAQESVKPSL